MEVIYIDESLLEECNIYLHPETVAAIKDGEPYSALLLVDQEAAVGAIAGRIVDYELLIESFYVEEQSRRKGGGRLLFESLIAECRDLCYGIKVCFSAVNEDMEGLAVFLESMGFREKDGGFNQMFLADLRDLEKTQLASRKGKGIPFSKLSHHVLRQLSSDAMQNGWAVPRNGFFSDSVDMELSMAQIEQDKVQAYAVVEHLSGYLSFSALQCNKKDGMKMVSLLSAVWKRAMELADKEQKFVVHTINEHSYRIATFLLPDAKQISHTMEREIF